MIEQKYKKAKRYSLSSWPKNTNIQWFKIPENVYLMYLSYLFKTISVPSIFHRTTQIVIFLILVVIAPVAGQSVDSISKKEEHLGLFFRPPAQDEGASVTIDSLMQVGIDSMAFPGGQVLIIHRDSVLLSKAYGYHTYDQKRPVQMIDLYDLASITKVTTAVPALMYLIDKGVISLDDKLCDLFPVLCGSDKADITLRRALSHYGRLQPYIVFWQRALRRNGKFRARTFKPESSERYPIRITDSLYLHHRYKKRMHRMVRKTSLNPEPGYVYSGLTFLLYPDLVKNRTGMRIDSFLYHHFFDPMDASTIRYRPLDHFPKERIVPTEVDTSFRRGLVHGRVHDEAAAMLDGLSCNAGLFASAPDLAKLLQMYLHRGMYQGRKYFSEEVIEQFTHCQYCEEGNRRGLGFDKPQITYDSTSSYVAKSASRSSYGHSGFTGTFFWVDPEKELIFILLTNRVFPSRDHRKLYSLGLRPKLHQAAYDWIAEIEEDSHYYVPPPSNSW